MSAGVYHTGLVFGFMPYSAMSAGMCRTSRLSAGAYHTVLVRRCMRIRRMVRAARAVVMHQYHTAQDCRKAGACCTYEPLACMSTTSYQIAGMWVCIIQSYVCRCIPYSAMSAGVHHAVLVCRCMPYSAMSAGMYHTSCLSVGVYHILRSYVCRRIPCHTELCLQAYTVQCLSAGVCHTVLCLRACTIHRVCL